jgi:hypothetical protein
MRRCDVLWPGTPIIFAARFVRANILALDRLRLLNFLNSVGRTKEQPRQTEMPPHKQFGPSRPPAAGALENRSFTHHFTGIEIWPDD